MKKLTILLLCLLIQNITSGQNLEFSYSFNIEVIGEGAPLILIPGLACSGSVWEETASTLSKNYQCHILTLPGFSKQEPISLEVGFLPFLQDEISTYIRTEFDLKPIIIGHSLGGFLALSIASTDPDLLSKIVIVDSYPFMSAAYNPNATEESSLAQAEMMKEMVLSTPDSIFAKQQEMTIGTMVTDKELTKLAIQWSIESDRATVAQAMLELMTTDLRDEVERVTIPILVLGSWYGAKDYGITKEMIQRKYETQFSLANDCKINIASTARHFIMWDEFDWFLTKTQSFLAND